MSFEQEREIAERAARAAGAIIRDFYERSYTIREKGHDNPVTEADLQANERIRSLLGAAFPDYGWLSEETVDSRERLQRSRVWIVDPLDGTKEFIQHVPELCVCIGLVEDGSPVLGISYNPIVDEMFSAARGGGAFLNGAAMQASETRDVGRARVLASRSEIKRGEWTVFEDRVEVVATGSVAYKLACIAAGRGDATFSLTPKNEWDVCSGAALLLEAGGRIADRFGAPLRFNRPDSLLPGIIATNAHLFEPLQSLIAEVGADRTGN